MSSDAFLNEFTFNILKQVKRWNAQTGDGIF